MLDTLLSFVETVGMIPGSENEMIKHKQLLYIEDNKAFREEVARTFLSEYAIEFATTVSDALEKCSKNRYDALLLDYDLAEGKGSDFLREFDKSIPIIAVSAFEENNDILLGMGASVKCAKREMSKIADIVAKVLAG